MSSFTFNGVRFCAYVSMLDSNSDTTQLCNFELQIAVGEDALLVENADTLTKTLAWVRANTGMLRVGYAFEDYGLFPANATVLDFTKVVYGDFFEDAELKRMAAIEIRDRFKLQPYPAQGEERQFTEGYVYLAYCDTGHYKIGRSVTPFERIQHFDTQMPVTVSLVHHFPCDNAAWAEQSLHTTFEAQRVKGEWFDLPDVAVANLRKFVSFEEGMFFRRIAAEPETEPLSVSVLPNVIRDRKLN